MLIDTFVMLMLRAGCTLYVKHFPPRWNDDELRFLFQRITCGQVVSAHVMKDNWTGESRGFGFVVFASQLEAASALQKMNGVQMCNDLSLVMILCVMIMYLCQLNLFLESVFSMIWNYGRLGLQIGNQNLYVNLYQTSEERVRKLSHSLLLKLNLLFT